MAWTVEAKYYEACNCELGCPCNMSGFPSHGACEGNIVWAVTSGDRDGVDLTGAKVAMAVKWPGAIHEGNGVAAVWVDASDEQKQALFPILMAEDPGLPFEILAATLSEIKGPYEEAIEINDNGTDSSVKVGSNFEMQLQTFTNPVSGEPHEAHMVLPSGFIFTDAKICTTSTNRVSVDGHEFDHSGKNGYYSHVSWSSENRMAPVVG